MTFQLLDGNLGGEEEEDYDERRRKRPSLLGKPCFSYLLNYDHIKLHKVYGSPITKKRISTLLRQYNLKTQQFPTRNGES